MIERGAQYLWMEVLHAAIEDAFQGVRGSSNDITKRLRKVKDARDYLTKPNADFDTVCSLAGMDADAVRSRMQAKLRDAPTPEQLVMTKNPASRGKPITHNGETYTLTQWAERIGVAPSLITNRLKKGWTVERALTPARVKGQPPQMAAGVVQNFRDNSGTGAGKSAQEIH